MTTHGNYSFIYAHKGATKDAADNTRLAFNNALKQKTEGIETDVQLTKDKVPILYHNRLMEEQGYPDKHICDFTFAQLKKINFSSNSHSIKAEGLITLGEFINSYRDQCKLLIEIKHRDWEDTLSSQIKVRQCLSIIGETYNSGIIISSFTLECLEYAHKLGTRIPLIYTFRNNHSLIDVKNSLKRYSFLNGICHPILTLDSALMDFLHSSNKLVIAYPCNSPHDIQKALDFRVDILITNDPETALRMRGS